MVCADTWLLTVLAALGNFDEALNVCCSGSLIPVLIAKSATYNSNILQSLLS